MKRLVILYFIGVPIPLPYVEIIKRFDEFYHPFEKVELLDINKVKVLCCLDENQNILYVCKNNNDYPEIKYTKSYSDMRFSLTETSNLLGIEGTHREIMFNALNKIMATRNGFFFHHFDATDYNDYYLYRLKRDYEHKKETSIESYKNFFKGVLNEALVLREHIK